MMSSAVGSSAPNAIPMSLIDSRTMTWVTPGCRSTSRSNRESAFGPNIAFGFGGPSVSGTGSPAWRRNSKPGLSLRTRFPAMPTFRTAGARSPYASASRRARKSGQRLFVSVVEPVPSVIESPSVTIAPGAVALRTSTRVRKNHCSIVDSMGSSAAPAWLPLDEM